MRERNDSHDVSDPEKKKSRRKPTSNASSSSAKKKSSANRSLSPPSNSSSQHKKKRSNHVSRRGGSNGGGGDKYRLRLELLQKQLDEDSEKTKVALMDIELNKLIAMNKCRERSEMGETSYTKKIATFQKHNELLRKKNDLIKLSILKMKTKNSLVEGDYGYKPNDDDVSSATSSSSPTSSDTSKLSAAQKMFVEELENKLLSTRERAQSALTKYDSNIMIMKDNCQNGLRFYLCENKTKRMYRDCMEKVVAKLKKKYHNHETKWYKEVLDLHRKCEKQASTAQQFHMGAGVFLSLEDEVQIRQHNAAAKKIQSIIRSRKHESKRKNGSNHKEKEKDKKHKKKTDEGGEKSHNRRQHTSKKRRKPVAGKTKSSSSSKKAKAAAISIQACVRGWLQRLKYAARLLAIDNRSSNSFTISIPSKTRNRRKHSHGRSRRKTSSRREKKPIDSLVFQQPSTLVLPPKSESYHGLGHKLHLMGGIDDDELSLSDNSEASDTSNMSSRSDISCSSNASSMSRRSMRSTASMRSRKTREKLSSRTALGASNQSIQYPLDICEIQIKPKTSFAQSVNKYTSRRQSIGGDSSRGDTSRRHSLTVTYGYLSKPEAEAVVMIQALVRGWLQRKKIQFMHFKIQDHYYKDRNFIGDSDEDETYKKKKDIESTERNVTNLLKIISDTIPEPQDDLIEDIVPNKKKKKALFKFKKLNPLHSGKKGFAKKKLDSDELDNDVISLSVDER